MLNQLYIENFKSLKKAQLDLKRLNILSGLNGMGKSSVIQSLLLLRQSFESGLLLKSGLVLKGNYIELGNGKDVFYEAAGDEEQIVLSITVKGLESKFIFSYSPYKHVLPFDVAYSKFDPDCFYKSSLFGKDFQYINAEHVSPLSLHKKSQLDVNENRQIGIHGEYAVHYLVEFGDKEKVGLNNLIHPKAKSEFLGHNVEAWLAEISPGIRLKTDDLFSVDQTKLGFEFENGTGFTNEFRPVNVGFGVSHILPVLVAILSAREEKLILIENPESHIHPRGQSVIGQLLSKASQNNIQLIVETHSDHILNGVRVEAFRTKAGAENVGLFFFERNKETQEHFSIIKTPILDNNGRVDSWPDGFFDEWERTLIELV